MPGAVRLAVVEVAGHLEPGGEVWGRLAARSRSLTPDVLLLNEMPFGSWLPVGPEPDADALRRWQTLHEQGLADLESLGTSTVLGSRPVDIAGRSVNGAFVWRRGGGFETVHTKQFFPDEPGFHEARWFTRGETRFGIADAAGLMVGFLICTDVMFIEWARFYGRMGAHVIAVPRATPVESLDRWKTVMRAAAIVSGCYVASSNRAGADRHGSMFGGHGWIIHPSGTVIAETSPERPLVVAEIDPSVARTAQTEYPCYVRDLPGSSDSGR